MKEIGPRRGAPPYRPICQCNHSSGESMILQMGDATLIQRRQHVTYIWSIFAKIKTKKSMEIRNWKGVRRGRVSYAPPKSAITQWKCRRIRHASQNLS